MPTRITLPVDNGLFASPDGAVSNQLVTNLMPYVPQAPGAAVSGALVPTWGTVSWTDGNLDEVEKFPCFVVQETLYQIRESGSDGQIWQVDFNGTQTLKATLSGDTIDFDEFSTVAYTAFEGTNVVVITERGGDSFEWEMSGSSITKITDSVFQDYQADDGGVLSVVSGDGYFIFCTKRDVFISKNISEWSGSILEFNALDYAQAEHKPDLNEKLAWYRGQLRVFGQRTIETWANVGGADFPFQRISGATIEKGLANDNADTLVEVDDSLIWVGGGRNETPAVWQLQGGQVRRLSNLYIEADIKFGSGKGIGFRYNGRSFYGISPGRASGKWVLDLTNTSQKGYPVWFKWSIDRYNTASVYGRVYIEGRYRLDEETFTNTYDSLGTGASDTTTTPQRQFTSAYLSDQANDVYVSRVELQMKNGTGLASGADADTSPTVQMEVSDDQGRTWKDFGSRKIGASGATRTKVVWNRGCGASPNYRLFRFTTNTAAETVFLNIALDIERAYH